MEEPVQFRCYDKNLFGILHLPDNAIDIKSILLMVVGGPQTRIGSHKLYVQLARKLASHGIAVFRFDYEGIGDSEGEWVSYKFAGPSILAALDYLSNRISSSKNIVLWSLCDGATASAVFAASNQHRVNSMILCNPYLHTEQGRAKTFLKYYYVRRVMEKEFWQKFLSFRISLKESIFSFHDLLKKSKGNSNNGNVLSEEYEIEIHPEEFIKSILNFRNPIRFLISSDDFTAMQFYDLCNDHPKLKAAVKSKKMSIKIINGADHTFSGCGIKQILFEETLAAIRESEKDNLTSDRSLMANERLSTICKKN